MKLYNLPEATETPGFRQLRKKEIKLIAPKLSEYLATFKVAVQFTQEEAVHFLNPRDKVVYSYVVEDPETKEITDFISFYCLPSRVLDSDKHTHMNSAYLYYYFNNKTEKTQLFRDALIMAKNEGFDVFNALDIMDNEEVFEKLLFKRIKATLHYYLFNYRLPNLQASDIGMVLC